MTFIFILIAIYSFFCEMYFTTAALLFCAGVWWYELKNWNISLDRAHENKWYSNETPSFIEKALCFIFNIRIIPKDAKLYLRRIYLSPRWKWLPFRVFLHHILLSDVEALHDHPSDFISIILKGTYRETKLVNGLMITNTYGPGSILINKAEHIHRLDIVEPVWSLVLWGKPRRIWGFWPKTSIDEDSYEFVPFYQFLNTSAYNNFPEDYIE